MMRTCTASAKKYRRTAGVSEHLFNVTADKKSQVSTYKTYQYAACSQENSRIIGYKIEKQLVSCKKLHRHDAEIAGDIQCQRMVAYVKWLVKKHRG
jgi:hypothetical protein